MEAFGILNKKHWDAIRFHVKSVKYLDVPGS